MLREFKEFIMRGNVVDLAVADLIGAAFGAVVTSLVGDVIMPPIGLITGGMDFKDLFVALNHQSYPTLAAAKTAGGADKCHDSSDKRASYRKRDTCLRWR